MISSCSTIAPGDLQLDRAQIARLCDRHRGVGADGVLVVEPAANGADFRMRYYNADGGEAEMCGNGARCFARYASRVAGPAEKLSFETPAGVIGAPLAGETRHAADERAEGFEREVKVTVLGAEIQRASRGQRRAARGGAGGRSSRR